MRLIHCKSLQLEEFLDNAIPPYAILSHTWESNEVSFADFTSDVEGAKKKHAFHKIEDTCRQAALDGLEYAWVDTTCINKASSAELSEAINSMFKWYQNAKICYAYLSDVTKSGLTDQLPKSRWFTRGWTLQELIAPNDVIFYGKEWELLGSKREHARLIGKITGIDQTVLAPGNYYTSFEQAALGPGKSFTLHNISIAKRMAWASRRQTTRTEDMAYCLLGIFDVNMPLLYGEGKKAFLRLQEEIIRVVNDASIFAWGLQKDTKKLDVVDLITTRQQGPKTCPILAESPAVFQGCSHISQVDSSSAYTMSNLGLDMDLPLIDVGELVPQSSTYYQSCFIGVLNCQSSTTSDLLGILLMHVHGSDVLMRRIVLSTDDKGVSTTTFLLGPRLAIHAVSKKIIITKSASMKRLIDWRISNQRFLVNLSSELADLKFSVTRVSNQLSRRSPYMSTYMSTTFSYAAVWDEDASVLTFPEFDRHRSLVEIVFQSESGDYQQIEFSVLIGGDLAIVHVGHSTIAEKERTHGSMIDREWGAIERLQDFRLLIHQGRHWIVLALLSDVKHVHVWDISSVDVHILDVTGLPRSQWAGARQRRIKELKQAQGQKTQAGN